MNLSLITVGCRYTADSLISASPRARAQWDFLKLDWEPQTAVQEPEDFLDILQQSVNENAVTVVLDGSDTFYTKTLIASGLGLGLEEEPKAREAVEEYCRRIGRKCDGRILEGACLPKGAEPFTSSETVDQGFVLIRGGRCIVVLPESKKGFEGMFCQGLYPFLLKTGSQTAVIQTMAVRPSKADEIQSYLNGHRPGKNVLPLLYEEDGQWLLSITAVRKTEEQSRQACESVLEDLESEVGKVILTAAANKKEKKQQKKKSKALQAIEAYNPEAEPAAAPKKKGGFELVRRFLLVFFCCTFLISTGYLGMRYYRSVTNSKNYENLRDVYENSGFPPLGYPSGYDKSFSGLYAINQDVAGWIRIPGTSLDYPVVQTSNNEDYHRRNFEKEKNLHGVPFVDYNVDLQEPSTNIIIYGHNIKNDDQMFNSLLHYWDPQYFVQHPVVEFDSVYHKGKYKIFAAFVANVNPNHGKVFQYHEFVDARDVSEAQEYINDVQIRSVLQTGVDVLPSDELLTLSTCTYEFDNARFVVVARKLRDGESEAVEASLVAKASKPLMPDIWYQLYGGTPPQVNNAPAVTQPAPTEPKPPVQEQKPAEEETPAEPEPEPEEVPTEPEEVPVEPEEKESEPVEPPPAEEPQPEPEPKPEPPAEEPPAQETPDEPEETPEEPEDETPPQESESQTPDPIVAEKDPEPEPADDEEEEDDEEPVSDYDEDETLSVKINGKNVTKNAYDIISGMVQAEMGSTFNQEALKAQAVAAYTYVKYNNQAGVKPWVATKTPITANVKEAVKAVLGETVTYKGDLANTTYCAANAGVTNDCRSVWGGSLPYLTSVESKGDKKTIHYGTETVLPRKYVEERISDYHDINARKWDSDPAEWFGRPDCEYGKYVESIDVCGRSLTGRQVREGLLQSKIKSSAFQVEYDDDEDVFIFTTYGYGHGVGMSQLGANYYAAEGWDYIEILEHYYPGTRVR